MWSLILRKRKNKATKSPYNPAKEGSTGAAAQKARAHLGLLPVESAQKRPNAEIEELPGGQLRTKHRFLLTTPQYRQAAYEEWKQAQIGAGTFGAENFYRQQTAADRFLSATEHEVLCWYLRIHVAINYPKAGGCNYSGDLRDPSSVVRLPPSDNDRTLYRRISVQLSGKRLTYLDWLARHEFALTEYGPVEDAKSRGQCIIDSQDWRRGEGGNDGYLAAAAEDIEYWRSKCAAKLKSKLA